MFCSTSITQHLLRGLSALTLLLVAFAVPDLATIWQALAVITALVLMRGCPACWLMGLVETVYEKRKKNDSP
ncbi:hypothetical protein [Undibacterium sp. TS12]|uniref:hypothetical protein n=1 Tax=Undibacterium sp. TS12 TaxID=2908202 RepID=UPI001F4CD54D|nr:hypothetical protein [Undibacterium sp. TS12]MCH8620475.1 hypothetical protein [Undibacterium sp. TS12]